jgi:hypothetical protein
MVKKQKLSVKDAVAVLAGQTELFGDGEIEVVKSPTLDAHQQVEAFFRVEERFGRLVPVAVATAYLGLSKQRVYQLLQAATFDTFDFCGLQYVPLEQVKSFKKVRRDIGRPKQDVSVRERWRDEQNDLLTAAK